MIHTITNFGHKTTGSQRTGKQFSFGLFVAFFVLCLSFTAQFAAAQDTSAPTVPTETTFGNPIHVLLFNYSVYDPFYARSIRYILEKNRSDLDISEFWSGEEQALKNALRDVNAVIVPYAALESKNNLKKYAALLNLYVEAGGTVIFTGTHEYHTLQLFDMIDVQGVSYVETPNHLLKSTKDRLSLAIPDTFASRNFAYPISVYSPEFVTIAEVAGKKSVGYVQKGKGKVIYAGIEFYYDEPATTRILLNALEGAFELQSDLKNERRLVEARAAKALKPQLSSEWKVYPNPFSSTAFAEITLPVTAKVKLELMNEAGVKFGEIIDKNQLETGTHTFELPSDIPNGIYFLRYTCGNEINVKKIVKMVLP